MSDVRDDCDECNGTGECPAGCHDGTFNGDAMCGECDGSGLCADCNGDGTVPHDE